MTDATSTAAADLANLRYRLLQATGRAANVDAGCHPTMVLSVLRGLIAEVDDVYDDLGPFAYPDDDQVVELLAISVAVNHARQGRPYKAASVLADVFGPTPGVARVA